MHYSCLKRYDYFIRKKDSFCFSMRIITDYQDQWFIKLLNGNGNKALHL